MSRAGSAGRCRTVDRSAHRSGRGSIPRAVPWSSDRVPTGDRAHPPLASKPRLPEGQGAIPDQRRRLGVVDIRPVGLDEPVAGAGIDMELNVAPGRTDARLQRADLFQRLEDVVLPEVALIRGSCPAEVAATC